MNLVEMTSILSSDFVILVFAQQNMSKLFCLLNWPNPVHLCQMTFDHMEQHVQDLWMWMGHGGGHLLLVGLGNGIFYSYSVPFTRVTNTRISISRTRSSVVPSADSVLFNSHLKRTFHCFFVIQTKWGYFYHYFRFISFSNVFILIFNFYHYFKFVLTLYPIQRFVVFVNNI